MMSTHKLHMYIGFMYMTWPDTTTTVLCINLSHRKAKPKDLAETSEGRVCVMIMFASSHNECRADYVSVWLCLVAGCCHQEMSNLSPWTWGEYLDVFSQAPEHVKNENIFWQTFCNVCGISHFSESLACMMEITSKARACPFSPWEQCFKNVQLTVEEFMLGKQMVPTEAPNA